MTKYNRNYRQEIYKRISFIQLFRLLFVVFCLYLLREAFGRWDGFSFYASFSEYIPALALMSILWTIAAFITTIIVWLVFSIFERLCARTGLVIKIEHLLIYGVVNILAGGLVWKSKRLFWPDVKTSAQLKFIVFICVIIASVYIAWLLRKKARQWFEVVHERITPLVWLFTAVIVLSVPVVGYYTVVKVAEKPVPREFNGKTLSPLNKERPNILLITFDALAARDMSLYGYHRATTPFISRWAGNATVFTRIEAENNHTSPATASLMTGKRVWTHQVYHQRGTPVKSDIESLPGILKNNGYFNVALVVNPFASTKKLGILDSFDVSPLPVDFYQTDDIPVLDPYQYGLIGVLLYKAFGDKIRLHDWILDTNFLARLQPVLSPKHRIINPELTKTSVPPEKAFNKFLEIYNELPRPFFAWIHVFPPHDHFLPPKEYRGMFGPYLPSDRYKGLTSDINSHDMHDLRILYDEFIRYCDRQFEEFILQLTITGEDNTVIILSSDHGESFQHGVFKHGIPELYEQLTHIPLIIKEPGQVEGKYVQDLAEQIDIPATILDFAHIPVPEWMEGRSLLPLIRDEKLPQRPAFSMFLMRNRSRGHQITNGLIGVWDGDYKLIHFLNKEKDLLFNLRQDPDEMDNLIEKEPETGNRLRKLIEINLEKANRKIRLNNIPD